MDSIAFVDAGAHPAAIPYYHQNPQEPIPPDGSKSVVAIGKALPIPGRSMPLEALLARIAEHVKKSGSIVIVCHGNDIGLQSFIGLKKGSGSKFLMGDSLDNLLDNADGKASDANTAKDVFLDQDAFKRLKSLIDKVRKLELDRVDARACNCGKNDVTLSKLQRFFNCNTFCAPVIYDSFGPIDVGTPTSDPKAWEDWMKDHKNPLIEGSTPDRFAYQYEILMAQDKVKFDAFAESAAAVKNWVKAHFPPGNFTKGSPVYHALLDNIHQKLIFTGDSGYRAFLAEGLKGQTPSRTIDVMKMVPIP